MVNSYVLGTEKDNLTSNDSLLVKILWFIVVMIFGAEILAINSLSNFKDTVVYKYLQGLTQIGFYFQYYTGSKQWSDSETLRYIVKLARLYRDEIEKGTSTINQRHAMFCIGLIFKREGVLYKG